MQVHMFHKQIGLFPTIEHTNKAIVERSTSNIFGKIRHAIYCSTNASSNNADSDDNEDNDSDNFDKAKPKPISQISTATFYRCLDYFGSVATDMYLPVFDFSVD